MAITLKTVLDGDKGQIELSTILQDAKNAILNDIEQKKTQANLNKLQRRLNGIFYPTRKTTAIRSDYYNQLHKKATEEEIIKIFENFDFANNTGGYYSAGKSSINSSTLGNAMIEAQETLEILLKKIELLDPAANKDKLNELVAQVEKAIEEGKILLEKGEKITMFGQDRITGGKDFDDALRLTNQLKAFAQLLSNTDIPTPQEAGVIFEKALALTNIQDLIRNNVISDAARECASESQFGSKSIKRGNINNPISYDVSIKLFEEDKGEVKKKGFKINKGGFTCTYTYNPSSAKEGKMDVQLTYGSSNIYDLRVSAKRWTNSYGDLGYTSIDAGVHRAASIYQSFSGQTVANVYKFAILTPKKDQINKEVPMYTAVQDAHEFATLALKSDIAMGLNQGIVNGGAGYANILIVDTGSQIKVRNLAKIVMNNKVKLSGYKMKDIESEANTIYNSMSGIKQNRTQSYLGLMTSVLNKMKVTINLFVNN